MRHPLFENHVHYGLTGGVTTPPPPAGPLAGLLGRAAHDPSRGRRAAEIADLARETLGLPDDVAVTVQQLSCAEPGCPPVETVIAVLAAPQRRWTIHRPLTEIDDALVTSRLTHAPHGDAHD
jgi:hypothetical protein